ncbi:hypothetical protein BDU57DRAFT_258011 [Ampelomyces quisqualis]|uniref:Uncharacterized protein n=1 Tax=Ampelomyces quisqualis TaxID=50730 RepID=A0A6A5QR80_AMPQU|nr:hypothetical protein BDU57DRAFT_258011 [Ampelomyces quisqualis]
MMLATISHSRPSPGPLPAQLPITVPQRPKPTPAPMPTPTPKPKLSVNTAQPRSFGKGASLRLDTLSAVSPTRTNTFSNAYPALSSAVTCTSHPSTTALTPYKQPHNLVSILANSPVPAIVPRKMAASRPMFPAEKRVSFRTPLEEEITTVRYTLAHSDLDASVSTLSTLASAESDSSAAANLPDSDGPANLSSSDKSPSLSSMDSAPRPAQPRIGDKRDSSSSEDEGSDTCPVTPVAGRRKRTRDWRWTLGPISASDKSASSTASDATSEDSN